MWFPPLPTSATSKTGNNNSEIKKRCVFVVWMMVLFWLSHPPASSIELWETRHFFWIRYPLSIWTESVWTSIICKWFMRAGISLPERFSETINISKDRSWDSKKKPWKIFYIGSYFHLMRILIHHLCIFKYFPC